MCSITEILILKECFMYDNNDNNNIDWLINIVILIQVEFKKSFCVKMFNLESLVFYDLP